MATSIFQQSFSPNGKYLCIIDDQGILRIWDTETNELKQEYTPNLHLSAPCTALTWVSAATVAPEKNKEQNASPKVKAKAKDVEQLYLALGTSNGKVSLYSFAQGKIKSDLKGEGHVGKINCIVLGAENRLYTCGADCKVIVWCLVAGKQLSAWSVGPEKPTRIAYLAHSNKLVVGGRQIKVYSVATQELLQTFTGHTAEVNCLTTFSISTEAADKTVEYALSTSLMERVICVWRIGKKGKNKPTVCTMLLEDVAVCLSCQLNSACELRVASVTRAGRTHLFVVPAENFKAEKPIKPRVTIEIASDSDSATVVEPLPAVAASLEHGNKEEALLLAYGDKHFMVFEQVPPNLKLKLQILVRTDPKKLYAGKNRKKDAKEDTVAAGTTGTLKTLTPLVVPAQVDYQTAVTATKRKQKTTELPMEQRLDNLTLSTPVAAATPKAQSKVQLLVQALHSKDENLLRSVLNTTDKTSIKLTMQRLPVEYVSSLVTELTRLMQQKRVNVEYASVWLKHLLESHTSQLLALGGEELLDRFGPCLGIIEQRAHCLQDLARLSGRLNMLLSETDQQDAEAEWLNNDRALIYEDEDTSESDADTDKSASDAEWLEENDSNDDDADDVVEAMDADDSDSAMSSNSN